MRAQLSRILKRVIDARIAGSPAISAKLRPLGTTPGSFVLERSSAAIENVPPEALWEGYAEDETSYLQSGREDAATMLRLLAQHGADGFGTVLDFGCAAGRILRHLPRQAGDAHWGTDISAPHIRWCQQHLTGCNFATTTTAPHLPCEDNSFDLVFAGSVFTHISDLADAWLLELRRVLKSGGFAYLTVHDLTSYELLFTRYASDPLFAEFMVSVTKFEAMHRMRGRRVDAFSFGVDPHSQVFYDPDYLLNKWGRWMDVAAFVPQAHDHQSVVLLRKSDATSRAEP